jgi:hypothetical protein
MRRLLAILWTCAAIPFAGATTFSTDATDLWWIPAESGWGANVVHQGDTLFVTLFAYGANNQPTWYVGPALVYSHTAAGAVVYSGAWYQTAGPWFGGTFDPSAVTNRVVGTAAFALRAVDAGTLAYSVDGVAVTKDVVRQTWRNNNLTGSYLGALATTGTGCGSSDDGYDEEDMTFTITHSGTALAMSIQTGGETCNVDAATSQAGKMTAITGTVTCDGNTGTFEAIEVEANVSGITGRVRTQFGSCVQQGRFGGIRRGA